MPPHIAAAKVAVVYMLKTNIVLLFGLYGEILVFWWFEKSGGYIIRKSVLV